MSDPLVSVILPAHDEAGYIGNCLRALLGSSPRNYRAEVIVVANACSDNTALIAQRLTEAARERGWGFEVIETKTPGKLNALNLAEQSAKGDILFYLDADVIVTRPLLGNLSSHWIPKVRAMPRANPRCAREVAFPAPLRGSGNACPS